MNIFEKMDAQKINTQKQNYLFMKTLKNAQEFF